MRERGERPANPVPPKPADVTQEVPAAIDWWRLDAIERSEVLAELDQFVMRLVRSYGIKPNVIPPCWFRHEALVQELLALFQYRNQQQYLPVAPPSAPLDFHYSLQLALGRIRAWTLETSCTQQEHNETTVPPWVDQESPAGLKHAQELDEYRYELETGSEAEDEETEG